MLIKIETNQSRISIVFGDRENNKKTHSYNISKSQLELAVDIILNQLKNDGCISSKKDEFEYEHNLNQLRFL